MDIEQTVVVVSSSFVDREVNKNAWGQKESSKSFSRVDMAQLQLDIQDAIKKLNGEGYSVVSMTPIQSGRYSYSESQNNDFLVGNASSQSGGWGFGFGYTDGVMILATRMGTLKPE